jgi:O-antigen ligase
LLAGVLITAAGSIAEYVLTFYFGINLNPYLYRFKESISLFAGLFPRSAAFSNEPGILAFYLETLGVLGVWLLWKRPINTFLKLCGTGTIVLGWALTFSAASVAILSVAVYLIFIINSLRSSKRYVQVLPFIATPIVIVLGLVAIQSIRDTIIWQIFTKITLQTEHSGSASQRVSEWTEGLRKITKRPVLGEGPGTAASKGQTGNLSWYLFLGAESGVFSLITVLVFISVKGWRMLTSSIEGKYWYLVGLISGSAHLAVISTFFHPFLWTLISTFDIMEIRQCNRTSRKYNNSCRNKNKTNE